MQIKATAVIFKMDLLGYDFPLAGAIEKENFSFRNGLSEKQMYLRSGLYTNYSGLSATNKLVSW